MYFKGRLMSLFESILLVFNERATMIQFFKNYFTDSLYSGLDWMWVRIHRVIMDWIGLDWVIKLLDWVGLDLTKWTMSNSECDTA